MLLPSGRDEPIKQFLENQHCGWFYCVGDIHGSFVVVILLCLNTLSLASFTGSLLEVTLCAASSHVMAVALCSWHVHSGRISPENISINGMFSTCYST